MSSKIVLVTGATEGIGKATALQLADKGYRVVIHGRNAAKAQAVVDEIKQVTGNADIDYLVADLSKIYNESLGNHSRNVGWALPTNHDQPKICRLGFIL
jgi:NAD(P)-dependent dehydrogenase (short-subunit alcohol dehydrogenase family)